jgi:hypothetical protein
MKMKIYHLPQSIYNLYHLFYKNKFLSLSFSVSLFLSLFPSLFFSNAHTHTHTHTYTHPSITNTFIFIFYFLEFACSSSTTRKREVVMHILIGCHSQCKTFHVSNNHLLCINVQYTNFTVCVTVRKMTGGMVLCDALE